MSSTTGKIKNTAVTLVVLAFIAFVAVGLPDGLLGVAWPSIRTTFGLQLDAMGGLLFASMAGYLTSSFLSGKIVARLGVGKVLVVSCALTGLGLIGYTLVPAWWMIILLGVVAGLGAGAIDAGLNTYVASHFKEGIMQWLHASYGVGVTLGPILMTAGLNYFNNWHVGYIVVGIVQIVLALAFMFSINLWQNNSAAKIADKSRDLAAYNTSMRETLRQPMVWLSVLIFLIYVGAEAALGVWVYTLLTESRGVQPTVAGLVTGSYWITFTIGRILAGVYTKRIKLHTLLYGSMVAALIGSLLLLSDISNTVSVIGVALIGFAIAPIFPGLVSDTSYRVTPKYAANTIGMQLAGGSLGSAGISALFGVLAQKTSLEAIPVSMMVIFVLLIGFFTLSNVLRKYQSN